MREELPRVAEQVVATIVEEVPSYTDAFSGPMGETIRNAVQLALGGFLSLASGTRGVDLRTPAAPAVEGAYQLGRGEARSGRSTDALLAAYRIGARVSWRELSRTAVRNGVDGDVLVDFAELVFAFIDELSAASVAGHTDETETTGRVRQRLLARVAQLLLSGAPETELTEAAERAGWAVAPDPDRGAGPRGAGATGAGRGLARHPRGHRRPGRRPACRLDAAARARRARPAAARACCALSASAARWPGRRSPGSTCARRTTARCAPTPSASRSTPSCTCPSWSLHADEAALADLRARVLAPLDGLRPTAAEKLAETLRAWLLHQGRRDDIAAALFVHPQTVRYRMGQLRDLYGDRLEDPDTVLELTLALA